MRRMRQVLMIFSVVLLAACGSSRVIREGGAARSTPRMSTPKYGATAVVRRGDTLYGIAFRNGIDVRDLAAWNGIAPPYTIYPGQSLRLYPRGGARPVATTRPSTSVPAGSRPSVPTPVRPMPPVVSMPVASPIAWRWPADGELIARYVAGEPTKQGIDVAGNSGAPVRAAADGVVVYSGSGLVGYGELIIVKHNDAWLSAYGHNRARLVNEGQLVKAGQQIAELGRTGAAREMLHFEIRYNGKPVDPLQYLPRK
ncbi:peptidoglycan DD-metalloendopeptidase family protein [Lysobacter sp. CFH 32150]|uniref:peptidoglycan DD-metalloendopeptidase family protein n=1 Tax=Lysobacter sp. CFH 32150 TaxID=2927128 RepID=UPI001FA75660|nr:peptidoglycan DD-metalloendopeptidase family protein [Lysobacter sp. CFH 32150]MCI4568832.1 peptidoglycan DD-metalloendopeptidase family protein [Lysobacter sp. CFH 32150]